MPDPRDNYRRTGATDDDRVLALGEIARGLDWKSAEQFELEATRLVQARDDTVRFARNAVNRDDLDEATRFLIFTMGAIACRRATDRLNARALFGGIGNKFDHIPLFRHLEALSLDEGSLDDLKRGLRLERRALEAMGGDHAGAEHAIASFTVQIAEQGDTATADEERLREALTFAREASAKRPGYAKFHYTIGRILRRLGDFDAARTAVRQAIEQEDRDSASAGDRLRDYRLELRLIDGEQQLSHQTRAADARLRDLEERERAITNRLERAEVSAMAGVAFVASAVGLLQITAGSVGNRPFWQVIAIVASFAAILFGAMAFGLWLLRRARTR